MPRSALAQAGAAGSIDRSAATPHQPGGWRSRRPHECRLLPELRCRWRCVGPGCWHWRAAARPSSAGWPADPQGRPAPGSSLVALNQGHQGLTHGGVALAGKAIELLHAQLAAHVLPGGNLLDGWPGGSRWCAACCSHRWLPGQPLPRRCAPRRIRGHRGTAGL